jgi:serine/threonine protein kinase
MTDSGFLPSGYLLKGKYKIVQEIGRGGFSIVYEAIDQSTSKSVAIKLLVPPPAAAKTAKERMSREILAVQSLNHPSIVRVFELLEEGGWTFLVMERVEGKDLQSVVLQNGAFSTEAAISLGKTIASALAHAHRKGILHRDVKPQNILLDQNRGYCLADFGSARIEGQSTLTHSGAFVGTFDYTAPEILQGYRADARSDIYSIGLTLFYCLTAKLPDRPFPHLPPPPAMDGFHPKNLRPDIPDWLDSLIARATSEQPRERFSTSETVLHCLEAGEQQSRPPQLRLNQNSCMICRNQDFFGLSVCVQCRGNSKTALLYLSSGRGNQRREAKKTLEQMFGSFTSPDAFNDVIEGLRPLMMVPLSEAENIKAHFREKGILARTDSKITSWMAMPIRFYILLAVVLFSGLICGYFVYPSLLTITPLFALLLLLSGIYLFHKPVIKSPERDTRVPYDLNRIVVDTIMKLQHGPVKSLMADILWLCSECWPKSGSIEITLLEQRFREILLSSVDASHQVNKLDQGLKRLEDQKAIITHVPQEWIESYSQSERARDRLIQRLLELIAVLSSYHSEKALNASGIDDALRGHVQEIRTELEIHAQVATEMDNLISARIP